MNYYWWKGIEGNAGNVYAENKVEAVTKVENSFNVIVEKVELLEKDVTHNRFTGNNL